MQGDMNHFAGDHGLSNSLSKTFLHDCIGERTTKCAEALLFMEATACFFLAEAALRFQR